MNTKLIQDLQDKLVMAEERRCLLFHENIELNKENQRLKQAIKVLLEPEKQP